MPTLLGLRAPPAERSAFVGRPGRRGASTLDVRISLAIAGLWLLAASPARAQDSVVAGTVVDAAALRPLEAVQITVVGSGQEARTDGTGWFAIGHLTGSAVTLQVRRLGYRPLSQTVRVGDRALRLVLREVAVALDAVVVTGTPGGTEARAVGNAVGTIDARKVLDVAPVTQTQDLLGARIPGLTILPNQGNVGTGGTTEVRGVSSVSLTNEPLIYVDGIRVDNNPNAGPVIRNGREVSRINDFNPEDIDSIEVIKGPAAATIYGTEASRGVIQMFTRQGRPGPARWNFTVKQGANWFMNPAGRLNWEYGRDPVTGALDSVNLYQQEEALGRPMFATGQVKTYGLSVSGGTEAVRYYLAGNYDDTGGMVSYNWSQRSSGRANLSLLPSDKLEIRTNVGFVHNAARLGQSAEQYDLMANIDWGDPATDTTALRGFLPACPCRRWRLITTTAFRDRGPTHG